MEDMKSKVYIKVDTNNFITRIEGQYSLPSDLTGWILLEEGTPCDRLNHAQSQYLEGGIRTDEGIPRYKYENGVAVLRSDLDEAIAEYQAEQNKQTEIAALKKNLADTDYVACKIAEGAATREEYAEILAQRQAWRSRINELE